MERTTPLHRLEHGGGVLCGCKAMVEGHLGGPSRQMRTVILVERFGSWRP